MSVLDCCIRITWNSEAELYDYLSPGWREYFAAHLPTNWHEYLIGVGPVPRGAPAGSPISVTQEHRNPLGDRHREADIGGVRRHLDRNQVERALLCHDRQMVSSASLPTVRVAIEASRAINDWMCECWLSEDSRFYGSILVATQAPAAAATEIRRCGGVDRIAAIALAAGGLAKPFGHDVYRPIYEAAHEVGLPILLLPDSDATVDAGTYPTGAGYPSTYTEMRSLAHQSLQSHIASLIALGVPNRYPSLRFLVLGGGIAWVVPWLWRLDTNYKAFRYDVLALNDAAPSSVFKDRFMVGTHPFKYEVDRERLSRYLSIDPEFADVVCYASGYPEWDSCAVADVADALPAEWQQRVLHGNAERFFGWKACTGGLV